MEPTFYDTLTRCQLCQHSGKSADVFAATTGTAIYVLKTKVPDVSENRSNFIFRTKESQKKFLLLQC